MTHPATSGKARQSLFVTECRAERQIGYPGDIVAEHAVHPAWRIYNAAMPLPANLQHAVDALLSQPGETESSLRRMVLEQNRSGSGQLPDALCDLVDKIAHQPWTITDRDFAQLKTAGYSEGRLYEITMAAALGAGLKRFDAGLHAIDEAS